MQTKISLETIFDAMCNSLDFGTEFPAADYGEWLTADRASAGPESTYNPAEKAGYPQGGLFRALGAGAVSNGVQQPPVEVALPAITVSLPRVPVLEVVPPLVDESDGPPAIDPTDIYHISAA